VSSMTAWDVTSAPIGVTSVGTLGPLGPWGPPFPVAQTLFINPGSATGYVSTVDGHAYALSLVDALGNSYTTPALLWHDAYLSLGWVVPGSTPSMGSAVYNLSFTATSYATGTATIQIEDTTDLTRTFSVAAATYTPGANTPAITSANVAAGSTWHPPVSGHVYQYTLTGTPGFYRTSSTATYTAAYGGEAWVSISATAYTVSFTKSAGALSATASITVYDNTTSAVVATVTSGYTWTSSNTLAIASGGTGVTWTTAPTEGHTYVFYLTSSADEYTTPVAQQPPLFADFAPYSAEAWNGSITATTYPVSFTKSAAALSARAVITITDVTLSTPAAILTPTSDWTASNTVNIVSGGAGVGTFVAPMTGHTYSMSLYSAADGYTTASPPQKPYYAAVYYGEAFGTITAAGYPVSFYRGTATANAVVLVWDYTASQFVATVTLSGSTTPVNWPVGLSSFTITAATSGVAGYIAPLGGHTYQWYLNDVTDGYTTSPYVTQALSELTFLTSIGTVGLWLDASQTSTISYTGSTVTSISEPAGLGHTYSMAITSGSSYPGSTINGLNTITFAGNTGYVSGNVINTSGVSAGYSFFVVYKAGTATSGNAGVFSLGSATLTSGESGLQLWPTNNTGHLNLRMNAATNTSPATGTQFLLTTSQANVSSGYVTTSTGNTNQGTLYSIIFCNGNGNTGDSTAYLGYIASYGSTTISSMNFVYNVVNNSIGATGNTFCEVIVIQHAAGVVLPVGTANQVLATLQWKWALPSVGTCTYV